MFPFFKIGVTKKTTTTELAQMARSSSQYVMFSFMTVLKTKIKQNA